MTNEQKLELIKSYIIDIENLEKKEGLDNNGRQHLRRALVTYNHLFDEASNGKYDLDELHENISSYLYILQ